MSALANDEMSIAETYCRISRDDGGHAWHAGQRHAGRDDGHPVGGMPVDDKHARGTGVQAQMSLGDTPPFITQREQVAS